ncbi:MAG: hypothetical protein E7585_08140 [Ruminococcaceae bacterium]|nr:hypothetical protein [Oscillospiraceae bacterium]
MVSGNLKQLRELVFASDNNACFIERERCLARLEKEFAGDTAPDKHARILSTLLSEVSTPVLDCDYFGGRVVEALPDEGMTAPNLLLMSKGHMNPDYEGILRVGLFGVLEKIQKNAAKKATPEALQFARNAEIVVNAVKKYTDRYAKEAKRCGKTEMARALSVVPCGPAYDFYSALQSIWIIHMIASCYVGSRDYAFHLFDRYMLPYYEQALREGRSEAELTELLAGFFMKTNEICGRAAHNYKQKPVRSQSSKQYVNIGGERPNAFSHTVLNAAVMNKMAQPQITVRLKPDADTAFTDHVFAAMSVLKERLHIYNYDLILSMLQRRGIPEKTAKRFCFSACCSFDLDYYTYRREFFVPGPQLLVKLLHEKEYHDTDTLLRDLSEAMRREMQGYADERQNGVPSMRPMFVFDNLLLPAAADLCEAPCDGNAPHSVINMFCPGIATLGDSLMVLDKLIFTEKRYTFAEFVQILDQNYVGHEALRAEILAMDRFGNDTENDRYAVLVGNAFLDAVDRLALKKNFHAIPGFYSLERDNVWREEVAATPDGRLAGTPFSENQSPTYGADKSGITALLCSLAKLPFARTATGGLNLTFAHDVSPDTLKALLLSYFKMGGLHASICIVNKDTLRDAMVHPEKYKTLTVRMYGFSEYFISLPEWQQLAIINRTAY